MDTTSTARNRPPSPAFPAMLGWIGALAAALVFGAASCRTVPTPEEHQPVQEAAWPGDDELETLREAETQGREDLKVANDEFRRAAEAAHEAAYLLETDDPLPPDVVRPSPEEVRQLQAEAERKRQRVGEIYGGIVGRYEEFLGRHPNNWQARHGFAWFFADHGDYLSAAEQWRQVVALRADFAFGYNNLGTVYNHLGRDMEAVDLYRKAISLKDDEPTFHFNVGNIYATHRTDVAAKFGWDLPRVFRECLEAFRHARRLDPENFEYANAIASQFIMAHHFGVEDWADEAIEEWEYCLGLDLTPVQRTLVLTSLARIHLRQKRDPRTARKLLLQARENYDTPLVETLLKQVDEVEKRHEL